MAKRVSFSKEHLEVNDIIDYKNDLEASLELYYINANAYVKFTLYSQNELIQEKKDRLSEVNQNCVFMILSGIESWIRIDYETRVKNKLKDSLSRELRNLDKTYDKTYKISIDLLCDIYKKYSQGNIFSLIKSAFKLRHWLAHGRYWIPKIGKKYDFNEMYIIAVELNKLLKNDL